jgi:Fe(3+) dicitrate transport protein
MKRPLLIQIAFGLSVSAFAQDRDTMMSRTLDSVIINSYLRNSAPTYVPDVVDMHIFAGKKTNALKIDAANGNVSQNLARQLFARIPGLVFWEMDGAGTQVNVGSRGTDAHRSIEMNMRQNGYNTNSDIFGYPENHYSLPMQAVESVQLVRGSAALQFGPQFGGMFNYKIREGDSTKPFTLESEQTAGSNNFFNSYNAVGGTKGKISYYAYYDFRRGDGWRDNAAFKYNAYYANIKYQFNDKGSIALQFSRMDYVQQIAGGLTDAQFAQDPKQSFRTRNFFQPVINIPAMIFKYNFSPATKLEISSHVLFGERSSIQYINPPNIRDTINTTTNAYNPRQIDRDYYNSFTTEARLLHSYRFGTLSGGVRWFTGNTKRKQKGVGDTGSDFNFDLIKPYGIDLTFTTDNYAAFIENIFQINSRFSVTPGVRYEIINTDLKGVINNATDAVNYKGNRSFPLMGVGLQYQVNNFSQLYGNISQAYRPYIYANVTPADRLDMIDPDLKDTKGYDVDFGYRGHYRDIIRFDVNAFYVFYGNRVGLVTTTANHLLTTNVGDAVNKGLEAYIELSLFRLCNTTSRKTDLRVFNSLAYNHARYNSTVINKAGVNTDIKGNAVENTPDWINKSGIEFQYLGLTTGIQYSYTGKSYNDALNTISSANGVTGVLPAWHVFDWSFDWKFTKGYHFSAGVNNITNEKYFNRRIMMYPGPGILPADGRTFYVSLGIRI